MKPVKLAECVFDNLFYKKSFVLIQNQKYLLDIYNKIGTDNRFLLINNHCCPSKILKGLQKGLLS